MLWEIVQRIRISPLRIPPSPFICITAWSLFSKETVIGVGNYTDNKNIGINRL